MLETMWNKGNSHSLLEGMQNSTATLEDSLAVSYKTKHTLPIPMALHGTYPKELKTYVHKKPIHKCL